MPRLTSLPAATHRAVIAYDQFLEGAASTGSYPGNDGVAIFLDQAGVAFFGMNHFARIDLDGHLVGSSPIPLASYGGSSMGLAAVVQCPAGFAAILGEANAPSRRFCLLAGDTWPDVASCAAVPNTTGAVSWDGAAFQLFSGGSVSTYDANGTWVADRPFPPLTMDEWPRAAWYVGDHAVFDWRGLASNQCYTQNLWVLPRSLDGAGMKYDAEPVDFLADWIRGVSTDTFAASLALGHCFRHPDYAPTECEQVIPGWPGAFLTVIGLDGKPELLRQWIPIIAADQLAWDGENLVALRTEGASLAVHLYVLDRQGSMVRVAVLGQGELGFSLAKYPSGARLVAVAPNDYIIVYNTTYGETYATRFQLVPL